MKSIPNVMRFLPVMLLLLAALPAAAQQPAAGECPAFDPANALTSYYVAQVPDFEPLYDTAGDPLVLPDGQDYYYAYWSDDGSRALLLTNDGGTDYRVFIYEDGEVRQLLDQDTLNATRDDNFRDAVQLLYPVFVPNSNIVLANTEILVSTEGIYAEIPLDVWALDVETGEFSVVLPYGEGGRISVSPDGARVLVLDDNSITVMRPDGSAQQVIYEGTVAIGMGHGLDYPLPVWGESESGEQVARVLIFPDYSLSIADGSDIYEIHEFTFGDDITSTVINTGSVSFFLAAELSPTGEHVAEWRGLDSSDPISAGIYIDGDDEPLAWTFIRNGETPFVYWADAYHVGYGSYNYETGEAENTIISLCGEKVE